MNHTRTKASSLSTGDTLVMFDQYTGDPYTVTLGAKKTYPGNGQYFEFVGAGDDNDRYGFEPDTEVMRHG